MPNPPIPGRSVVSGMRGIVAASQPLAAMAGVQVLDRGGNAVDAALAASAVIGVVEPTGSGVGGDLFVLLHHAPTNRLYGLDASGWSPAALTREELLAQGHACVPQRGAHAVTVPGVVDGWERLHERFGALPLATLLAPAIHFAAHGFPVTPVIAGLWRASEPLLAGDVDAARAFLLDGRAPRAGEVFRRPALARTLERIAAHGRDGFYTGETADAIVASVRAHGGLLAAADLAEYRAEWVEPVSVEYRGWRVSELPPAGQGLAALLMLALMERFPLGEYGFHSAAALHVLIEAKKLAYADLLRYVGDPRRGDVPVAALLADSNIEARAALIDRRRAAAHVEPSRLDAVTGAPGGDTIYLAVIDEAGTVVSLIQSNYQGFGSGVVPPGTGFMLQNRGSLFTLEAGHANTLAPRKRPLHTIIPGFMERDGVRIGFGIMGGWNQAQAHAQFVSNVVDHGLDIQQALEAGRFTKKTFEGCDVQVEALVPEATRTALAALGHVLQVVPPRTAAFGFGQAVLSRADGVRFGASDPRHDGLALPQGAPVFGTAG